TAGRSRLGRQHRLDRGDEPPRGGRAARHPQRGTPAEAVRGTETPESAPEVLVLLLLRHAGPARGGGAPSRLALLPALPARREPALYRRGARALRRGVVPGGSGGGDDRLLPGLGETVAEGGRGEASSDPGQDARDLGGAGFLSRLRPRRA